MVERLQNYIYNNINMPKRKYNNTFDSFEINICAQF